MKILKSEFKNIEIGLFYQNEKVQILFGNKKSSIESIHKQFPKLRLKRIKQTHSDTTVQASDVVVEADGHFSAEKNSALIIATADCTPVLIYCTQTQRISSIHAGWKGIANQIVLKALKQLIASGSSQKKFNFWIGPHILQNSFEIDEDVLLKLEASSYGLLRSELSYQKENKFYVNLSKILYSQIQEVIGPDFIFNLMTFDTKTDEDFWSFRRDKERAGRNLSFISLK